MTAQSQANITGVAGREALSQEDAIVSAALAAHQVTAPTRVQVAQLAGARQALIQNALVWFNAQDLAAWNKGQGQYASPATLAQLTQLENEFAANPTPFPLFTAAQWDPVANAVLNGYFAGGVETARAQVAHDQTITNAAWRRVALAGGVGLVGLLLSIGLSILLGRWIIRRLAGLEQSAVTLAGVELPGVVARLRRGEDVPVEELTGQQPEFGRDEIGRVAQAFDAARRTAIEAAVGEARMRRGINDVFRNLARRNQSLLHRELTVLDGMERRTTDPETLEDLFRLDHLTTRMRRHSEGLIILSGAAPGRGWVHPVRMIDVLRAAAAEVEDYSRVTVTTPSAAALTGPAVADVIHLLAELIENATTLSPPYTPVRVSGDLVASGFAVEIEDRGLGMSEQRYVELNGRLAEPPEFDVFNSEQLGLFVVGQLAKRHGIRVTLRPSPYGGTTAIALIPTSLVGVEEGFVEGLPTGMSAISSAWAAGHGDAADGGTAASSPSRTQLGSGPSWGPLPLGNGSSSPVNGDTRAAGTEDPFGSFGPGPSSGSEPYAGEPYPGQANGSPSHSAHRSRQCPRSRRPQRIVLRRTALRHRPADRPGVRLALPAGRLIVRVARGNRAGPDGDGPAVAIRPSRAVGQWDGAFAGHTVRVQRPGLPAGRNLPAVHPGLVGLPATRGAFPAAAGAPAAGRATVPAGPAFVRRGVRLPVREYPVSQRRDGLPAGRAVVPARGAVRRRGYGGAGRRDVQGPAETGTPGQPGAPAPGPGRHQQHAVGGVRGQRGEPLTRRHPQRPVGHAAWLAAGTRGGRRGPDGAGHRTARRYAGRPGQRVRRVRRVGYAGSAGGSLSGEERLVTDVDRPAAQSSGNGGAAATATAVPAAVRRATRRQATERPTATASAASVTRTTPRNRTIPMPRAGRRAPFRRSGRRTPTAPRIRPTTARTTRKWRPTAAERSRAIAGEPMTSDPERKPGGPR